MSMSDEYPYYAATQFLGRSGVTRSCLMAMATILTSSSRPEKITAVIGSFGQNVFEHESVLFLVWDWFYPGITIVSDGFGTHGGEGGAGLSTVLGLIKFYKIPLAEVWIYEKKAFQELAKGKLSEEMFEAVQQTQPYNWKFYPLPRVRTLQRGKELFLEVKRADDGHTIFEMKLP